ncbi:LysM peptidoglycan-binding domain-containing protein [Phycisphaerales bacterium AB-hyl4]|uniref:LysM peptidoglycan-binding domain-containing protein n=1 Tax=Natronomicrosphaera hydrolytica TaxID=3242702 RepID=A0ABV4U9C4_9BACT
MTSSYKIALLAAGLLCVLVVGYYLVPDRTDDDNGEPTAAESSADDAGADRPASLVRRGSDSAGNQPGRRSAEPVDATPTFEDPAPDTSADDDDPGLPPSEDPGMTPSANDQPVIPVGRNGDSMRSNLFESLDVADAADEPGGTERSTAEREPESEPDPEPTAAEAEPEPTPAAEPERTTTSARNANAQQQTPQTYTVQSGDTLSSIANDLYGAERHWVDIARANPRVDPIRLRIGQELRLPADEVIERRSAASTDADLESPPGTLTHVVRPGETLTAIAHQHYNDSSRWRVIFNANRDKLGADPNRVTAGDELTIPPLPRN